MRLHTLTVSAFGPFPTAVQVDFDAVCSAGLFLIHGATGAGKTSLLDAICFALFADVPGARSRRGLASDHAAEGTRPVVTLDFTAGDRRLRIERSPEFSRPKKRGAGLTKVPAAVILAEWTGSTWRGVSTRHDEVADVLDQLLGMGLQQFSKVVVLPQGDVSAFLRATPEDRRVLLERLFDISTFTAVEDWLVEERKRSTAEVVELRRAMERELDRLHDRVSDQDTPPWRSLPTDALPVVLAEHAAALESAVLQLLTRTDDSAASLSKASADLHAAQSRLQTRQRGVDATCAHEAETARADEITGLRLAVDRAAAAEAVSGHLAGFEAALLDEARATEAVQTARRDVSLLWPPGAALTVVSAANGDRTVAASEDDGPDGGGEEARVQALAAALRASESLVTDLLHATHEETLARVAAGAAAQVRREAEQALLGDRAAVTTALAEVDQAQDLIAELTPIAEDDSRAQAEFDSLEKSRQIATEATALELARAGDAPAIIAARDEVLSAQQCLISLQQRRLEGMAAELATALARGGHCPVCGSTEHPALAVAADVVTGDDLDAAEAALDDARHRLDGVEERDTRRLSRIETLREQLGAAQSQSIAELTRQRDAAGERLQAARTARRSLPAAQRALTAAVVAVEDARARETAAVRSVAAAQATEQAAQRAWHTHAESAAQAHSRHSECPCSAATASRPQTSRDAEQVDTTHRAMSEAVQRLAGALQQAVDADARCRDRRDAATRAAAERGFSSLAEACSARREPTDVQRWRAHIAEHEQLLAVATATLADEAVSAALAGPRPDVEAFADAERRAYQSLREAQAAHSAAEGRLSVLRSVEEPLRELVGSLTTATARAAAVKEVADAATGAGEANIYRMRLSAYVLAARLEQVVALANERLHRMQSARYLLEHSDARVSGGARSGLDLRVLDQWTGRTRDTASLSGGESFVVSLALALGLADAVREESGGFDLGTLFVDEGFGSLDEESLEQVMGVLDGLREGGRAVGVVSHVPDLRARISHQVVVEKTATGSDVSIRTVA